MVLALARIVYIRQLPTTNPFNELYTWMGLKCCEVTVSAEKVTRQLSSEARVAAAEQALSAAKTIGSTVDSASKHLTAGVSHLHDSMQAAGDSMQAAGDSMQAAGETIAKPLQAASESTVKSLAAAGETIVRTSAAAGETAVERTGIKKLGARLKMAPGVGAVMRGARKSVNAASGATVKASKATAAREKLDTAVLSPFTPLKPG